MLSECFIISFKILKSNLKLLKIHILYGHNFFPQIRGQRLIKYLIHCHQNSQIFIAQDTVTVLRGSLGRLDYGAV